MRMQVDLIEQGEDGIWSPDIEGIEVERFEVNMAIARAENKLRELAKYEDISREWQASVRVDGEPIAEIEL